MSLQDHLALGLTTVCRCWSVVRRDGRQFGFTDHDRPLAFDGITFNAGAGLTASAVMHGTGLSVDNSEALGVLSDDAVSEADIKAGRFDGAEVQAWLVNWQDVRERQLTFRGHIGEIRHGGGAFYAELRGLTEALNQPQGRVFHRGCAAVLGDSGCGFDLSADGFSFDLAVADAEGAQQVSFDLTSPAPGWFERGRVRVLSGAAAGLIGLVKRDVQKGPRRVLDLWEPLGDAVAPGDMCRIEAGCDKHVETCRAKFDNLINFQGFPHIPGDDWLISVPRGDGTEDGGSLNG